jgi:cobalt-zinc-cadmium resistance protein CzcA
VIATRNGVPITVEQVATVKTGQAIRMGSASENGTEVVVGTAIMRIGENSRIVSTAVAEKLKTINASLPPDVVIQPVLNRTELVNSTIKTVAKNLSEGAVLVIVVLFLLLGNFRGPDRGVGHPDHHDADRLWYAARWGLGQSDEPWGFGLRSDRRRRRHHR